MNDQEPILTSGSFQMLIESIMQRGRTQLSELEAERFLNAVARLQSGVPAGVSTSRRD